MSGNDGVEGIKEQQESDSASFSPLWSAQLTTGPQLWDGPRFGGGMHGSAYPIYIYAEYLYVMWEPSVSSLGLPLVSVISNDLSNYTYPLYYY